ncbi:MAG: protein kinase [Planctomycetaceae bacterium]
MNGLVRALKITRLSESSTLVEWGSSLKPQDTVIERKVAIKILHDDLARDESLRNRFISEARAVGRLNHPNVLTIHEVGTKDDLNYLVMEYAGGGICCRSSQESRPLFAW